MMQVNTAALPPPEKQNLENATTTKAVVNNWALLTCIIRFETFN
jgi:hypothetical protein